MVTDGPNRLNRRDPTTLPPALSMRSKLANRTLLKSALSVGGVFVALIVIGSLFSSGPSQAMIGGVRIPGLVDSRPAQ